MKKILKKILRFFVKRENDVSFLGNGDALPKPLSKEEEEECLKKVAKGDKEAKNYLIEHNLRLVVYIAKKFDNSSCDMDDLVICGTMGLLKAVNTFKGDKNIKLATYASRCIENEILMYLRKKSKSSRDISLEEPIHTDSEGNVLMLADILVADEESYEEKVEKELESKALRESFETLNKKEQEIIKLRFGIFGSPKKTQKEIADYFGISQSYISRLEKKIMSKLKEEIDKRLF